MLPGIIGVIGIMCFAGFVAYIGDRVGHQIGRRRLTLFGLRPRYTSTIIAVATGMVIALSVTLVALAASDYVRKAFFDIDQLNAQTNEAKARELAAERELSTTRNGNLVLPARQLVAPTITLDMTKPEEQQLLQLSNFFDESVAFANRTYTRPPYFLKPDLNTSLDPEMRAGLRSDLETIVRPQSAGGPVVVLPVAAQNLFRDDTIAMQFFYAKDQLVAKKGEVLAETVIDGGTPFNVNALFANAAIRLVQKGMPPQLLQSPGVNEPDVERIQSQLPHLRGRYRITVTAANDTYSHTEIAFFDLRLAPVRP